jgi:voltage-gated potassium channel
LVILASALTCAAAFGVLHFSIWTMWPAEYLNMHGIEDSLYFSVVTMATVGYGDILPVGHLARLLCILEILSGISLLVVGVSASMTVWLQINQPVVATVSVAAQAPPPDKPSDCNAEPVKQLDG